MRDLLLFVFAVFLIALVLELMFYMGFSILLEVLDDIKRIKKSRDELKEK